MTRPTFLLTFLCLSLGGKALAQTSPTAQDSLERRLRYQDSVYTAHENQVNAITLTDTTRRSSINSSLKSAAATTPSPTVAPVDTNFVYPTAGGVRYVYDTGNIVDVLRHSKYNLTAVCAHRGYFQETGVPENSLKAIQRASDNNLEMVELDIKMSRDGVPVLSHDMTIGRTTVGGGYDLVSNYYSGQLQGHYLRDKDGNATTEHMPTLEQALDYIHDHRIAIVVALDIKDRNAAKACWAIVRRMTNAWNNPAYNWVIFKINATVYNYPADLVYDLPGLVKPLDPSKPNGRWVKDALYDKLLYIPVYTTNMVDKLNCLESQRQYKAQPFCVALEINYKQEGGILHDQMADIHADAQQGIFRTKAIFNAIPDATSKGPDRFWKADGYHTYRLQDIYYTAKNGERDTDDKRGDWGFITDPRAIYLHMITTDKPTALSTYLGYHNLRYTHWYRPHPDGTNDEVDPHGTPSNAQRLSNIQSTNSSSDTPSTSAPSAYPNPTQGTLTVSLTQQHAGPVQLRLTDQLGRILLSQEKVLPVGTQQVTLPNLSATGTKAGLYLLQITPTGGKGQTIKVQVE